MKKVTDSYLFGFLLLMSGIISFFGCMSHM